MKTFLKKSFLLFASLLFIGLQSCEKEDLDTEVTQAALESTYTVMDVELSKDQLAALQRNAVIPETNTVTQVKGNEGGVEFDGIYVHDLYIPYEQLNSWIESDVDNSRLWITQDRVTFPAQGRRNLTIGLLTESVTGISLNGTQRNAAITAIQRYNALNMNKIRYTSIIQGDIFDVLAADTYIRVGSTSNNADGTASFPFSGNPGRIITLNSRTATFDQNVLTLLVQHEMGHTLGLRHSDFTTRRSCGQSGESSSGAEVIPGTDASGNITNSIMRACGFGIFGNFQSEDINSLRTAYGGTSF